ncbi:glycerate 2-kinase [Anaeramoeba flamelloides]|uniref:Glycerate 2-kinase n=1 Tax=Anaeramoeba flamelloides TaxID=1746091 RepID=A0ABQ8XCF1_9EUKA|nr:glycerate 2-kinase [Anaeramoeba flamelloides]
MLKTLLAFNNFKDSITAQQVGVTVSNVLTKALPGINVQSENVPVSDGGDRFIETLEESLSLEIIKERVVGPLGEPIESVYGMSRKVPGIAVVEMAKASGLELVPEHLRNPLETTTYGTGQLIKMAIEKGAKRILIGIGGSATNDAGLGALQALGLQIEGERITSEYFTGRDLNFVTDLHFPTKHLYDDIEFQISCDVKNPFLGVDGAVNVYSEQKGATQQWIKSRLEDGMKNIHDLLLKKYNVNVQNIPGSGAAGGFSAAFLGFTNTKLESGIKLVSKLLDLENKLKNSDLVFTGEGKLDSQTEYGKAISYIMDLCEKYDKPLVCLCGHIEEGVKMRRDNWQAHRMLDVCDFHTSMNNPTYCLEKLIMDRVYNFPLIKKIAESGLEFPNEK